MVETAIPTAYETRVAAFEDSVLEVAERTPGDEANQLLILGEMITHGLRTKDGRERDQMQTRINESMEHLEALGLPHIDEALSDIRSHFISYIVL